MNTFVIGDVHGSFQQLASLLDVIKPNLKRDRLIMLGDYIDRGPNTYLTVKKVMSLQKTFGEKQVVLLRGNHEQMAIDYYQNGHHNFFFNGGDRTVKDFKRHNDDLGNYLEFFKSLPTYFEDEHFIYVHGGIRHGIKLSEQRESDLLWIREEFYMNQSGGQKTVIFGHTPTFTINGTYRPFVGTNCIGIDTGCVYGGYLSALQLNHGMLVDIYQVMKEAA